MSWMLVVAFNVLIVACYIAISATILRGLIVTGQMLANPLGLATSLIFATCALHHGEHALHFVVGTEAELACIRSTRGETHAVAIDLLGATVAILYLSLRRRYQALLHTPAMFEDRVAAALKERLHERAYRDGLTGLENRAALDQFDQELRESDGRPLLVAFVDLDQFKPVNDTWGHERGDRVLREIAHNLLGTVAEILCTLAYARDSAPASAR